MRGWNPHTVRLTYLLGYVKNREKHRQPFTMEGKTPMGRLRVIMPSV